MAMKLSDFLQLLVLLLVKFHQNILTMIGREIIFRTDHVKNINLKSNFHKEKSKLQLFECYSMHNSHVWFEIVFQIDFVASFLILANFFAFLHHTIKNADVSNYDG